MKAVSDQSFDKYKHKDKDAIEHATVQNQSIFSAVSTKFAIIRMFCVVISIFHFLEQRKKRG